MSEEAGPAPGERADLRGRNVSWHRGLLSRESRWTALGGSGATVWFTGLPSSGKSTVAAAVEARLVTAGRPAYLLDGDNLRHGLNADLGFSPRDRAENVRRAAAVAHLFADAGTVALVSLVSPYAAERDAARRLHEEDGLPFLEVWVNTPPEECERRDPKGLYARARAGTLADFTGIDAPYEPPVAPELELRPDQPVEAAVEAVLGALAPVPSPTAPREPDDRGFVGLSTHDPPDSGGSN